MGSTDVTERSDSEVREKLKDKPKAKPTDKTAKPAMYAVVLHNDPFTPRAFVVDLLQVIFQKDETQSIQIMLGAHRGGYSIVEIYSREVAEMKSTQANHYAAEQGRFLLFSVEKQ